MVNVLLVGVPGVGKTTIAKAVSKEWKVINFGDIIFEIAEELYNIRDRDEMIKRIPKTSYKKLQLEAANRIASMKGNKIIDTHCSIFDGYGYFPGLPLDILLELKPDAIVLVEADVEDIMKNRAKDITRHRFSDPKEQQEINRYYVFAYSAISGAPVYILRNKFGELEKVQQTFIDILSKI